MLSINVGNATFCSLVSRTLIRKWMFHWMGLLDVYGFLLFLKDPCSSMSFFFFWGGDLMVFLAVDLLYNGFGNAWGFVKWLISSIFE